MFCIPTQCDLLPFEQYFIIDKRIIYQLHLLHLCILCMPYYVAHFHTTEFHYHFYIFTKL